MYVKQEEIDTIYEVVDFIEGQIEAVDDTEYWFDFLHRVILIAKKMQKARQRQL